MARALLRDSQIKAAKARAKEYLLADGEGLYVRVRSHSVKDWLFIYTWRGQRRKEALGRYPTISVAHARSKADWLRQRVIDGRDPRAEREREQLARIAEEREAARHAARPTLSGLFERWHALVAAKRRDQGREVRRSFEKDILPKLGDMYADTITKGHVMTVLDAILARDAKRMANNTLTELRQLFRWAQDREVVTTDPTATIRKKNVGGPDVERERVLSQDEIRELAAKLPASGLTAPAQAAFWVILATMCRIGELAKARRTDVDLDGREWRLPETKNNRAHVIHLSEFAVKHFRLLLECSASPIWVLPNLAGDGHISGKVLQKQFYDRQRGTPMKGRSDRTKALRLRAGRWTAHDLRRTAATLMGEELGVRGEVIERALNHVEQNKVKRIYQRQELHAERKEAFERLGDRLDLLARGRADNVLALPVAGRAA